MEKRNFNGKSLMIATPMYGGMCTAQYVRGVITTIDQMKEIGVTVQWAQISNESLITRGRNQLVQMFLEQNFEYFLFVDADISFMGSDVLLLLLADKDVVCGIYPKKEIDWGQVEKAAKQGKENLKDYSGAFVLNMDVGEQTTDVHGLLEVRHGGTGFMLIKRRVFEMLAPHVPQYRASTIKDQSGNFRYPLTHEFFTTSIDSSGCLLSEDYHFCDLWRKHGGKIYANPFIKLEHIGTHVFSGDLIKGGMNAK